jgi:hypothetical protein
MNLFQKIEVLFDRFCRREAARHKSSRARSDRAQASAETLYDAVSARYPIQPREELPQLSDAAYEKYVLKIIETRSMVSTVVAGLAVREAARKTAPEDDQDARNLGF